MNDLIEYRTAKLDELKIQLDLLGINYRWRRKHTYVRVELLVNRSAPIIEVIIDRTYIHVDSYWSATTRYIKTRKDYKVKVTKANIDRACKILLILAVRISKGDRGK